MCKGKTREERYDNAIKQATANRESAARFLHEAGITTKSGNLIPQLR